MNKELFKIVRRVDDIPNDVTAPKDRKTTEAVFDAIKNNYRANAAIFMPGPEGDSFMAQETKKSHEIHYKIQKVNQ